MHTIFWLENLKGRDHLEDLGVDGKIILQWKCRGCELDSSAQDGDRWQALVNTVMNLWVPYKAGNFLTS
jgi:hypothetical protein